MALKAGYYGLKRRVKNKLLYLLDSVPADISPDNPIAGKNDVLASIDLLNDTVGWSGKNKNPLTLDNLKTLNTRGTWNNNVYTYSGITYTVNIDSIGRVLSIIANGTNSSDAQVAFCVGTVILSAGDYVVSGLVSNGGYTSYWLNLYNLTDSSNVRDIKSANEYGKFTLSAEKSIRFNYYVAGSATVSNITIYPMICTAEQFTLNPAYEPYHVSVAEMIGNNGTYDVCLIVSAVTPSNGAQPEFFIPWFNPEFKTATFSLTIRLRGESAWQTLEQSGSINIQKVCKNGFLVNPELTTALTANTSYTFRIDGTITFGAENREISSEPEVKVTKKATKK